MAAHEVTLAEVVAFVGTASETDLDRIDSVRRSRKRVLDEERGASLQTGDRVRIVNVRPKYLTEMECTIKAIAGGRAFIEPVPSTPEYQLHRVSRYLVSGVMRCQLTMLEKVSSPSLTSGTEDSTDVR